MKSLSLLALAAFLIVSCASGDVNSLGTNRTPSSSAESNSSTTKSSNGRTLFLKNCAHCHGSDARGNEGPDLHGLDWTDEQIARRIRNGKKGQMTAFAQKLSSQQITEVIAYLRSLK